MKKVYALGAVLVATLTLFACSGQGSPQIDQTASLKPEPTPTATPRSQNSEIVIPVAPKVVDYHGTWNPVVGFDPLTIPVEKGFFNGTMANTPGGSKETPEGRAYALRVWPDAKDAAAILVAPSRDRVDKNVVLLSGFFYYLDKPSEARIAFTIDGEQSWCNLLNLLPHSDGSASPVRVSANDTTVQLFGADTRPGYHWWEATVNKSELPCS